MRAVASDFWDGALEKNLLEHTHFSETDYVVRAGGL